MAKARRHLTTGGNSAAAMRLAKLLRGIDDAQRHSRTATWKFSEIAYDSRRVKPGTLFVAIRGEKTDGNQFVSDAVSRGAVADLSEQEKPGATLAGDFRGSKSRTRARLWPSLRQTYYGRPAEVLKLDRRDGHERQNHDCVSGGFDSCAPQDARSASSARSATAWCANCVPRRTRLPNRSICRSFWPKSCAPGARTRCSKPVRTRWRWTACGDARLRWLFLRTSRATIWIITRRSRIISRPSAACLKARAPRAPAAGVINRDDEYGQAACGPRRAHADLRPGTRRGHHHAQARTFAFRHRIAPPKLPSGKSRFARTLVGRPNVYNILAAIGAGVALGPSQRSHRQRALRSSRRCRAALSASMRDSLSSWWWTTRIRMTRCATCWPRPRN